MNDTVTAHCAQLDRCNQRGGRMLSVLDLLDAGTLELDLAAYLMARISRGASLMVGASPGGAGKTTVMCALVNLLPVEMSLTAATREAVGAATDQPDATPRCYICHEIGPGPYYAYLWGADLRAYCALSDREHVLATNLHADDLDEARDQVCGDNAVPAEAFGRFDLLVFLRMAGRYGRTRRTIDKVYTADDRGGHVPIFDAATRLSPQPDLPGYLADPDHVAACDEFLRQAMAADVRTIEQTRRRVVAFLAPA